MFKFNHLIPEMSVSDIDKSLHFYLDILSFKLEYERKEDKFSLISLDNCQLMLEEVNGYWNTGILEYPFGRGVNFQILTENVSILYNNLKANSYPIKIDLEENWYRCENKLIGQKEFLVMDPDGYLLRFSENLGEKNI